MDIGLHQICEAAIDELMALHGAQPFEIGRDDANAKMAPAIACAGVTCMQMAVVDQLDGLCVQRAAQLRHDAIGAAHCAPPSAGVCGILEASHTP